MAHNTVKHIDEKHPTRKPTSHADCLSDTTLLAPTSSPHQMTSDRNPLPHQTIQAAPRRLSSLKFRNHLTVSCPSRSSHCRRGHCGREGTDWYRGRGGGIYVVTLLLGFLVFCDLAPWRCVGQNVSVQTRPEYFIDVLVVGDAPIYDAWFGRAQASAGVTQREAALNNVRRYFALVIQEVNKRYRTLEKYNDFRLTVRPVGFIIAETPAQSQWTVQARDGAAGQVDAQRALRNLARWAATARGLPQHDHTMLLTGYDLVTDDSGALFRYTIGRATVGTACQGGGRSVSILEDRGAFQSVHTAAHELGHSLGAGHDGTGNTCSAADRFIMAGGTEPRTPQNLRHPWFFSPCSARAIARYVTRLLDARYGRQCLFTALPQVSVPDVRGIMPGQLYPPDEQCQHIYGPQSRYCYGGNFGTLAEICTSMFCLVPQSRRRNFCVEYHAAHGTSCGPGKWCEAGACVANQNAPAEPVGDCPFGDQLILVNRRSCPDAVAARPALCYNARIRRICCATCAQRASASQNANRAACPFGDRLRGCRAGLCNRLRRNGTPFARDCCGTCNFDARRWTCADASGGVDGVPCGEAVQAGQVQGCYNDTLAFLCCRTCQAQRDPAGREGCEFGDILPVTCQRLGNFSQTCTRQQTAQCCRTCNAANANDIRLGGNDVRVGTNDVIPDRSSGNPNAVLTSAFHFYMCCLLMGSLYTLLKSTVSCIFSYIKE